MAKEPYFPRKPLKLDYVYFHVGRISVNWALAEDAIDACLRVFARALPDPLYELPISTQRRISDFRKKIKKLKLTDEQRLSGSELIDRFSYLAWHRHWTTHGTITNGTFEGQTWRKQKGFVNFERLNLSTKMLEVLEMHLSDLEDMGDEAVSLYSDIWDWLTIDLGCATPKTTENVVRKIGITLP
ncbi:hypothetical protein [Rhizobium sp. RU36D]|uniref:hypothetical protein n=1 Tax=Rhizobium sp. RU36D TaxID=1907415 RepID=UPI000A02EF9A|nr:hypothetical protein [Rhizobium sp. RU36D]